MPGWKPGERVPGGTVGNLERESGWGQAEGKKKGSIRGGVLPYVGRGGDYSHSIVALGFGDMS